VEFPIVLEGKVIKYAWVAGSNSWGCKIPEGLSHPEAKVLFELGTINGVGPWRLLEISGKPIIYVGMHGWFPENGERVEAWEAAPRVVGVLKELGVTYAMGDASVGGIQNPFSPGDPLPPGALVVPTGFRMEGVPSRPSYSPIQDNFFRVGEPFCASLRCALISAFGASFSVFGKNTVHDDQRLLLYDAPRVRYVCTMWGRVETEDEIDVFRMLGDHVVGMSIGHEAHWMRALGIHFGVVDAVVNYAESGMPQLWVGNGKPEAMRNYYEQIAVPLGRTMVDTFKLLIELDRQGKLPCNCDKYKLARLTTN